MSKTFAIEGAFRYRRVTAPLASGRDAWVYLHVPEPPQLPRIEQPASIRMLPTDVILRYFETPDEVREMVKGRFELVHIGGLTIGRASYEPGWRWSEHVGPTVGATRCSVEHVGLVLTGTATAAFADGRVVELRPGALFYIPPEPHDSWVIGDDPYVSLHFLGADHYAR